VLQRRYAIIVGEIDVCIGIYQQPCDPNKTRPLSLRMTAST